MNERLGQAGIYIRVSSEGQEDNYSPEKQEQDCRQFCEREHLAVDEQHVWHETWSGDEFERVTLQKVLHAAKRHEIQYLVCARVDRLSRDVDVLFQIKGVLAQVGVKIRYLDVPDTSPFADIMVLIKSISAQEEHQKIKQNLDAHAREKLKKGRLLGRKFPLFGYRYVNPETKEALERDPETAPIVRLIFEEIAAGRSLRQVADDLNERGVLTPSQHQIKQGRWWKDRGAGKGWQDGYLWQMLHNPAYTGQIVYGLYKYERYTDKDKQTGEVLGRKRHIKRRQLDDAALITLPESACPAIVTPALAQAALAQLAINKERAAKKGVAIDTLLLRGGFAFCGHCGGKLYSIMRGERPMYYCSHNPRFQHRGEPCRGGIYSYRALNLDAWVWAEVRKVLTVPDILIEGLERWRSDQTAYKQRLEEDEQTEASNVTRLEEQRAGVWDVLESPVVRNNKDSKQHYEYRLELLSSQLENARARLAEIRQKRQQGTDYETGLDQLRQWGKRLLPRLEQASLNDKQEVLQWLGAWLEVYNPNQDISDPTLEEIESAPTLHSGHLRLFGGPPKELTAAKIRQRGVVILPALDLSDQMDYPISAALHITFTGGHLPLPHLLWPDDTSGGEMENTAIVSSQQEALPSLSRLG